MAMNDKIRDEKLQYGINREAAKISALLSGKIFKYKYPTKNKYYLPIKAEFQNYLSLVILFWEKLLNKLSQ